MTKREEAIADLELMNAAANLLIESGLEPMPVKIHVLEQVAKLHPDFAPQIEAVKKLVAADPVRLSIQKAAWDEILRQKRPGGLLY